ncbi:MAG: hypothetical protein VYC39_02995 [Myxococcota bacterium]|nr:hypothetical protein [Myxococcota bacterium]
MASPTQAIDEFVKLAILQRKGELPLEKRPEMDALGDVLRDLIDGSHAAPRKLENPDSAARSGTRPNIPAAKLEIKKRKANDDASSPNVSSPSRPPPAADVKLSKEDESKVQHVEKSSRPSGYTPSVNPYFLDDYYTANISLEEYPKDSQPTKVKPSSTDSTVQLRQEERILFGMANAEIVDPNAPISLDPSALKPVAEVAEAPSPPQSETPRTRTATGPAPKFGPSNPGVPTAKLTQENIATVHFLAGGSQRVNIPHFEPNNPILTVSNGATETTINLREVMSIFFQSPNPNVPETGQKLIVTLKNDREMLGTSFDYAPGVKAMHIVPQSKRGQVSYVWVPAWAVKGIRFA